MLRPLGIGATAVVLVGVLVQPVHAGTCWDYRRNEKRLAGKINNARRNRGLPTLRMDPQLSKVSRTHSTEMARRRSLYHTSVSVLSSRVTRWVGLGENVGRTRTIRRAFRLMMRSSYHRANILDGGWVYFGVGTVSKGRYIYSTVTFESVMDPGTTLSMC
jgi:uncharacterized protein YkwD